MVHFPLPKMVGFVHRKPWIIALIMMLFLGLSVSSVTATHPIYDQDAQPENTPGPISTLPEDQLLPRVAYADSADEYLVVWEDVARELDHDIYAIRVDNLGLPNDGEIPVGISGAMDTHPDIAYNPWMDEYFVVWENEYSATDHDIFAQRVGPDGNLIGGEIHVAYSTNYDEKPVVSYDYWTSEYLVVYERRMGSDEFYQKDIIAQRVNSVGTPVGNEIAIANGPLDEQAPAVACDGFNYLVVWQGDYVDETNIYSQRIGSDGSMIGGQINISTWENDQLVPRVTYNSDDSQYFVVWEDHHYTPWSIYGYRLDENGNLIGSQVSVATGGAKNRSDPDVNYYPDSRSYLVVWQFEYSIYDHDIYSRRVAYDGSQPEAENAISTLGSEEMHPAVASNKQSQALLVWEDQRNYYSSGIDIYGSAETVNIPILSGLVYEGDLGDYSTPLPGVLVELGCSNSYGYFGDLIYSSVTDAYGQYFLPAFILCEYYNIVETDPEGYYSVGSSTNGGAIINSNWIVYTYPLTGKVLSDNLFWDKVIPPVDDTPPGNWTDFQPPDWVNVQTVNTSEQVEDTLSGLDVSTAQYRFSIDGGSSWSGWLPASITGQDGTTAPQTISATIPFGRDSGPTSQNLAQFRVADMQGNLGEGPTHAIKIDSVLPSNPTNISSSTHTPNVWSNNPYIALQWSGASDDRSGIYGYSVSYDQSPTTIPDVYRETENPDLTIYAYYDSTSWWFHVRTLDNAGNAATGAVHYGPFAIDTDPPIAWFTSEGGQVNVPTIIVSWDGGDTLSGVIGYDVQTSINSGVWTYWKENTPSEFALYDGIGGQDVQFRVRARDAAGNLGEWSDPILVSFGVDVVVKVQNESGSNLYQAKVFHNDSYIGLTNSYGTITVPDALLGDTLAALFLVHEEPAGKSNHGMDGNISWAWRVYQTSMTIPNVGEPILFHVTDTDITQLLTVRKNQALIGVHIIAVVQWDATSDFLADLKQGMINASSFLYDVTDGQFFYEMVEIYDNEEMGPSNDVIIYTDNTVWPNAFLHAITAPKGRMMFPPVFNGSWSNRVAYGTLIHEFGHYGLWLDDEYKDRTGGGGGFCTFNRGDENVEDPARASIMYQPDNSSELCSRADPNHLHNPDTIQDVTNNGETTWETVMRVYTDKANPSRWTLQSPDTRHVAVVPGPNALPIAGLVKVYIHDNNTNACAPYVATVKDASGKAVSGADVYVESMPNSTLYQGQTDYKGQITVRGQHNGDTLKVTKNNSSSSSIITCSPNAQDLLAEATPETVIIEPDPFTLDVKIVPLSADAIQLQVASSIALPAPPQARIWQDGADQPSDIPLTYDGGLGLYVGEANLDASLDLRGILRVSAIDSYANNVTKAVTYNLTMVDPQNPTWLRSEDGRMEILLQPGSLAGNPVVSIQPASDVTLQQGSLTVAGNAYQVLTSNGEYSLQQPVTLNIYFSLSQFGVQENEVLGLYRWDANTGTWILISTNINPDPRFISAQITQLGTYAVLAPPIHLVHLPLVDR
jgi:hypothetical protein